MKLHLKKHSFIIILSLLFVGSIVLNEWNSNHLISMVTMVVLTIVSGFPIFKKSLSDLRYKIIGIDLLVTIAVMAAFVIGDWFEAAAVTYLFTLGHYLERSSLEKTRSALKTMMDLKPTIARLLQENQEKIVGIDELQVGDHLLVKMGEKIPTDGVVVEGNVLIDEAIMTGESMPVERGVGAKVLGSTLVTTGYLKMQVTQIGQDTSLSRMIHMVEEAQDNKAKTQQFMEVFSKYYTPFVVVLAIVLYLITFNIRLAVTMLVIACPGALVIATPVSFVAGIGNAAKKGILFKGGDAIEKLAKGNIVFFDKTGTLTKGKPELVDVVSYGFDVNELIRIAAIGETYSEHPLAFALIDGAKKRGLLREEKPTTTNLIIGKGIEFVLNEATYKIGNHKLFSFEMPQEVLTDVKRFEEKGIITLLMGTDQAIFGIFGIADGLRPKVKELMNELGVLGIQDTVMLTGDQEVVAKNIAKESGIQTVYASLMPDDKASIIQKYQGSHHTIFVGDGINDALALSYADASVAVGGMGKDLAMETADVVLMSEDINRLKDAIQISRKVKSNMIQNIIFALLVVLVLMVGVIFEKISMSIGMLVHEASVLLVIVNAIRLLRYN